jgi:hypothetical protein
MDNFIVLKKYPQPIDLILAYRFPTQLLQKFINRRT